MSSASVQTHLGRIHIVPTALPGALASMEKQKMKAIPGVELEEAIDMARAETDDANKRMVASAIKDIMFKTTNARLKLERSQAEVEANKKALAGFEGQLTKIAAGDWSALPEAKELRIEDKKQEPTTH